MILVDTSIWIDFFRTGSKDLTELLLASAVLGHPWVTGELALGTLPDRDNVLPLMVQLPQAIVATDDEVLTLITLEQLHAAGIGYVDAQLIASARLTPDAKLWTKDKTLAAVAARLGVDAS